MCTKCVVLNIKGLLGCSCPIPLWKLILVWNVKCINLFHIMNSIQIVTLTLAIIHMNDSAVTIKLTMEFKLYTECNLFYFCHGNGCSEKMSQMVQVYLIFDSFFLFLLTGSFFIKENFVIKLCIDGNFLTFITSTIISLLDSTQKLLWSGYLLQSSVYWTSRNDDG